MKHTILTEENRWFTYVVHTEGKIFWSVSYGDLSKLLNEIEEKFISFLLDATSYNGIINYFEKFVNTSDLFKEIDVDFYERFLSKSEIIACEHQRITLSFIQINHPELLV